MTEHIVETTYKDEVTVVYIERDMGIATDNPALLGEIVRCRDCKFFYCGVWMDVNNNSFPANPNGYCAWGERKEEDA